MPITTDKKMSKRRIKGRKRYSPARMRAFAATPESKGFSALVDTLWKAGLPEDVPEGRHSTTYVRVVLEVARTIDDPEDIKTFAQRFLSRDSKISTTTAGLSALKFEAWLLNTGETLFAQFIETVVQDSSKFLVVLEGPVSETNMGRLTAGTVDFVSKIETTVKHGDIDRDAGEVSDFTILTCTAKVSSPDDVPKITPPIDPLPTRTRVTDAIDDGDDAPGLYESGHESGMLRSRIGSWAIFEAPTDGGGSVTVVAAKGVVWAIQGGLEEAQEMVEQLAVIYSDLPHEFDLCVESALTDMVEAQGVAVENADEVLRAIRVDSELIEQRDDAVAQNAWLRRLSLREKSEPKKENGEEEEGDDRMDDPLFYRDDLQAHYDMLVLAGATQKIAIKKVKLKFKVKELVVTPVGEVRSPGIVDRPVEEPSSVEEPESGEEKEEPEKEEPEKEEPESEKVDVKKESVDESAIVGAWARKTGKSRKEAKRLWDKAAGIVGEQYPDVAPESDRWYQLKVGIFKRMMRMKEAMESAPVIEGAMLVTEAATELWSRWLRFDEDDGFEDWVADCHPEYISQVENFEPNDLHEARKVRPVLHGDQIESYEKWCRLMNVRPKHVLSCLRSPEVREAMRSSGVVGIRAFNLGKVSARRYLRLKNKPPEEWTEDDWNWAKHQIRTVNKLRLDPSTDPLLLKLWGHNTKTRELIDETAVIISQRVGSGSIFAKPVVFCPTCEKEIVEKSLGYDDGDYHGYVQGWYHRPCGGEVTLPRPVEEAAAFTNRVIDCTPGIGPYLIGEAYSNKGHPDFKTLKKNRVDLDPEQRAEVMRRSAVWHHGPKGQLSPAVWRSEIGDKTWYVTNTHRCFNCASTLQGAIGRYHAFVKGTA